MLFPGPATAEALLAHCTDWLHRSRPDELFCFKVARTLPHRKKLCDLVSEMKFVAEKR